MQGAAKETVIIVHGTWAAPEPGNVRWYQPADRTHAAEGFVGKLDAALEARGSPARCWAHCSQGDQIFHWSGDNSWIARTHAAARLGDYVAELGNEGWRCHIVAHSHGGNVVVEALPQITEAPGSAGSLGMMVTLGTPFIDTMSPIVRRARRRTKIINFISWAAFAVFPLVALLASSLLGQIGELFFFPAPELIRVISASVFISLWLAWLVVRWRQRHANQGNLPGARANEVDSPRFLAIGSNVDEAWQILYHMRNADNPLAIRSNWAAFLFSSLRSHRALRAEVARIHGAKSYRDLGIAGRMVMAFTHVFSILAVGAGTLLLYVAQNDAMSSFMPQQEFERSFGDFIFLVVLSLLMSATIVFIFVLTLVRPFGEKFLSAFLSPLRSFGWCVSAFVSLPNDLVTYVVRRRSWSVLLAIALGLEGYRFAMPGVDQSPDSTAGHFFKYESMAKGAADRALDNRSAWIARHLGDISQSFSKLAVTAADISALLRTVEEDQTLVHGAYYSDDACIARIAEWIAGRG
jgi:hypothetical protein